MLDLVKIRDLASNNQSPFYIFDLDEFQGRLRDMQEILGADVQLAYAMKANPFLVHAASELPVKFEVCSPGEFAICERERIDMKRIILSGVNKEKGSEELAEHGGLAAFAPGMIFKKAGGTESVYNDNVNFTMKRKAGWCISRTMWQSVTANTH